MLTGPYRIFISYSRSERGAALVFAHCIQLMGGIAYVAERDMQGGRELRDELTAEIERSKEVFLLVSGAFIESKWTGWEIGVADALKRRVIPVLYAIERAVVEQNAMWNAHLARMSYVEMSQIDQFLSDLRIRINEHSADSAQPDDMSQWIADAISEFRSVMEQKLSEFETSIKARRWRSR